MNAKKLLCWPVIFCLLLLSGCGGSGPGESAAPGTLSLRLVDATLPGFAAIYVTVDHVDVHPQQGDWETVLAPMRTVNLLELVNGFQVELGLADLAAGPYTQLRLILAAVPDDSLNLQNNPHPFANYFISDQGQVEELKVPSGLQTGIKLVNGFTIASEQITTLLLDFDAARSVVLAGNSGQYLLKPTIKVLESAATVSGSVFDNAASPLPNTLVSAQATSPIVDLSESRIVGGTLSDELGRYALFLNPGSLQLVAYRPPTESQAYLPACRPVTLAADQKLTGQDFILEPAVFGSLAGTISIASPVPEQHVVLSLRQPAPAPCSDTVELVTANLAAGPYGVDLPVGSYQLVASGEGLATLTVEVVITEGATAVQDLAF
jgi:hypothetical protein